MNTGDYSVKKVKQDKYVPVPDNIITGGMKKSEGLGNINITEMDGR